MAVKLTTPRLSLNKSFLKVKPHRDDIEIFKLNVIELLDQINEKETEEFHKNIVSKFLHKTYYQTSHYINTKGRNDLVIHTDKTAKSPVGVIIEAKKPGSGNKSEMSQKENLNTKGFQELVLYYMRERIIENNIEVKHLIISNIYEWFVFDASIFEKAFAQNKEFVKLFIDFEEGRLAGKSTDFFYKEIAEPAIANLLSGKSKAGAEILYTYFDIRDYEKIVRNSEKQDDKKLIALFKLLSPEHLLKLPFKNDSNSLDKPFYAELLHIIGLSEVTENGRKIIDRKIVTNRSEGSLIENTITQLESLDKLARLEKPSLYGRTTDEKYFNVALELVITWINRILFLKLLEAQLLSYHKGDSTYSFLNKSKIKGFDDLNSLFFQVLAKKSVDRNSAVKLLFDNVPYLNSSLFEPTELEQICFPISQLEDNKTLPIHSKTILKDSKGDKIAGDSNTLEYLFSFLEAYDFSSEGSEAIQEDNKTLINASVLGLIFEKINGYKEGSFFTPGFITMFMCRDTIRKTVLEKFNETQGWRCNSFHELYNKIEDKKLANDVINSIKIIDPAVGSGHFLVSALNEIVALKSDLKILLDRSGKVLRDYHFEVSNDELVITDENGNLFEYNPRNKESQRIQESLFHEKQTLIENCLFGVDINTNSVKICRLRLWIELLKNAYYKSDTGYTELETLPNIDINIKCGNSLVSRYSLDVDLSKALKKSKITVQQYKDAVQSYRHASTKEQKREMEVLIAKIKGDFKSEISNNDPLIKKLNNKRGERDNLINQHQLFDLSKAEQKERKIKIEKLNNEVLKLENEVENIKSNKVFESAFEWRFEFPEILDDDGGFVGFDVVLGNPPYIRIQDLMQLDENLVNYYNYQFATTGSGNYDLYIPFIELGYNLLRKNGNFCFIMPHKFLNANYGENARTFLIEKTFLKQIIHFGALQVFEDATTYTGLFSMAKTNNETVDFFSCDNFKSLNSDAAISYFSTPTSSLTKKEWNFLNGQDADLLKRLKNDFSTLEFMTDRIFQGLKTSADKIYILEKISGNETEYEVFCRENQKKYYLEKSLLYPLIKGGNSRAYTISSSELLILFPYQNGALINSEILKKEYPKTWSYLSEHKTYLEKREHGKFEGNEWYQFGRNQAIEVINKSKLFTPDIAPTPRFSYDMAGENFFTGGVAGGYGILAKPTVSPLYLLAILNSPVAFWFITKTSTQMRGGWYSFESRYIKNIPVPKQPENTEDLFLKVQQMLQLSKSGLDTSVVQSQLNDIIYKLYSLTEQDVTVINSIQEVALNKVEDN